MSAKKRPLKRTYKRSAGPMPVLRRAGPKPDVKPIEVQKGNTGQLPDASRAVILRLVETVKGL
jgi:hypothetical protein